LAKNKNSGDVGLKKNHKKEKKKDYIKQESLNTCGVLAKRKERGRINREVLKAT